MLESDPETWGADIEALDYAINLMNDCKCSLLHRFNEGDRVKIREDLAAGQWYDGLLFSTRMEEYKGKQGVIRFQADSEYMIEDWKYLFNDCMLEPEY